MIGFRWALFVILAFFISTSNIHAYKFAIFLENFLCVLSSGKSQGKTSLRCAPRNPLDKCFLGKQINNALMKTNLKMRN